jgi:hypothetical protein
MHRRLQTVVIALAGLTATFTASAACFGYYCQAQIQMLYVDNNGVYIRLVGDLAGLTNCTPEGAIYLTLPKTNNNYTTYYATLLAAYMAKEPITIRATDASVGCTVFYVTLP